MAFPLMPMLILSKSGPTPVPLIMAPGMWERTQGLNYSNSAGFGYSGANTQTKPGVLDPKVFWPLPGFEVGRLTHDWTQNTSTAVYSVNRLRLEILGPSVPANDGWETLSITPAGGSPISFSRSAASSTTELVSGRSWNWNNPGWPINSTNILQTIEFS